MIADYWKHEKKLISFQKCSETVKQHEYLSRQIGDTDQIPVYFNIPQSTTVNSANK
jgi:hypothetical protein